MNDKVHEAAEKLRSMSDEQLVATLKASRTPTATGSTDNVKTLLNALADGECKGVKGATAYKIAQFAQEKGLV